MSQRTRDSWDVWRNKVNLSIAEYDPAVIIALIEQIDTLKDKITTLQGDMTTAESNISILQNNMSTAQGSISQLQTDVGSNTSAITGLRTDLDTTGDVLNGIYPLVALGDVTMYQNVKGILDGLSSS